MVYLNCLNLSYTFIILLISFILFDSTSQAQYQVQGRLFLDVVVGQRSSVFELLAREDESLLVRRDTLFVLDLLLHSFDGVCRINFQGDSPACQSLHEDLHASFQVE